MSSRSKHRTTANLIGLIATTTLLIGAFTWAYQNYSTTTSTTTEQEEEEPHEGSNTLTSTSTVVPPLNIKKNGTTKPILLLSTTILPSPSFLTLLSSSYTLHLLLPSSHRFTLPESYSNALDHRRILFHETGEGLIHLSRSLGGILIVVKEGLGLEELEGEEVKRLVQESLEKEEREEGIERILIQVDNEVKEVQLDQLVKEVKNFVQIVLVVVGSGGERMVTNELGNESKGQKVIILEGWDELSRVLRC